MSDGEDWLRDALRRQTVQVEGDVDDAVRRALGRPTRAETESAERAEAERRERERARQREREEIAREYLAAKNAKAGAAVEFDGGPRGTSVEPSVDMDELIRERAERNY
jgi:hypothetical protein